MKIAMNNSGGRLFVAEILVIYFTHTHTHFFTMRFNYKYL